MILANLVVIDAINAFMKDNLGSRANGQGRAEQLVSDKLP